MAERKTSKKKKSKKRKSKKKGTPEPAALVIGAGVGGMRAALDIAESGRKVYLLDRSPKVGGTASQLDKWFPTDDCSLCKLLPPFYTRGAGEFCLRRTLIHPNIEILTSSELAKVDGEAGAFEVTVVRRPRMVDKSKCVGCNKCIEICPIEAEDDFNEGLIKRKAIYLSHPNAVPNNYCIDVDACDKCGKCVEVCPTDAINLDAKEETLVLSVGAIVADPGFKTFAADELDEFGHSRYPNVVTSTEFERMLSGTSPKELEKIPKKVAFFQCVGSRDEKRPYCSSACCMYAIKEANLVKDKFPDSEPTIFFMDMRAFGKGYHRYYQDAAKRGVKFVRSRVPAVEGVTDSKELIVSYEDESGKLIDDKFDMVVLSVGQTEPASTIDLAKKLGIELNPYGFCGGLPFDQVATSRDGIFVCGSFSSPADIPDTVVRASAAACEALKFLPESPGTAAVSDQEEAVAEPVIGVFLCSCGEDVSNVVDLPRIAEEIKNLPYVKTVSDVNFLCVTEGLMKLTDAIKEQDLNRVVVAACSIHPYEMLFRKAADAAGIDPEMLTVVNIREQLSWVHEKSVAATEKAKALIEGAVEKAAVVRSYPTLRQKVVKRAVVIGGGIAGITAAIDLADSGLQVELIEKTESLGGRVLDKRVSYEAEDLSSLLNKKMKAVRDSKKIHVRFNSEIKQVEGCAGDFQVTVAAKGKEETIAAGAIIIAVGAQEERTGHETSERIIALSDFEKDLFKPDSLVAKGKSFVFILCVGSRTEERPFCSRVCCSDALLNALKVKEINPDSDVFVLYRDIMTYGFNEELYTKARDAGVIFVRYDLETYPKVEVVDSRPKITVRDPLLNEAFCLRPDYLVLAFGMDPSPAVAIAKTLNLRITEDLFLEEANVKFRPVDLPKDGMYVCGTAHSPMSISEAITSAHAAAARAGTLLSKDYLPARSGVAEVNKRRCSACELCITACPFEARYMDYDEMIAQVREHICQGCGTCTAVCPNGASTLRRYEEKDIFAMLEVLT
ncbi:CoB--CoM heterodisulfide reductase iron-sulfur subunit A family protein [candidate division TA06 bacterium]|uniref:CoB--CoM heterodisulfide reductase iron-sulfur subunit A family protein n=2 Tax=candidate division TA06 bacterium TaxID=2250710 RepID=A0A523UXR6_UNCT6|nr:MAG: CoB--CoM heterodisulfide reductase iron-sulfur subunit A family protein [candidate division TA06 bacterium]